MSTVPDVIPDQLARLGVSLEPAQLSQCSRYLDLLYEANQRFNLTAIRDIDEAWDRHIVDSLTVLLALEQLSAGDSVVDVGSGAGLPGIIMAIARPDLRVTMIEATGKKANFIRDAVKALGLTNARVVNDRAETAGQRKEHRHHYDIAVARAIGPMNVLLELTLPLVRVGGMLIAMKGPRAEEELRDAGDALEALGGGDVSVIDAYPEGFDRHTVLVMVTKDRPTPKAYPRLPGMPKQSPL